MATEVALLPPQSSSSSSVSSRHGSSPLAQSEVPDQSQVMHARYTPSCSLQFAGVIGLFFLRLSSNWCIMVPLLIAFFQSMLPPPAIVSLTPDELEKEKALSQRSRSKKNMKAVMKESEQPSGEAAPGI
jgi:hypothetical protein